MPKKLVKHKWQEKIQMIAPSGRIFEVDNDEDYIATLQQLGWKEVNKDV